MANALANLATSFMLLKDETVHVHVYHRWILPLLPILQQEEVNATLMLTINTEDWQQPIIDYYEQGKLIDELCVEQKYDVKLHASFTTMKHSIVAHSMEYFFNF